MEKSLQIYRDILGFEVVYELRDSPASGKWKELCGIDKENSHLIFLKSHIDHKVGVLGLLCYPGK